jgi:urease accessory protein
MPIEMTLVRLMAWLSPGFPVGAYAYSQGVEKAVDGGLIADVADLIDWVGAAVVHGPGRLDADLFRLAWQAVDNGDVEALHAVAERAALLRGTAELALESAAQGAAFRRAVGDAWPSPSLSRWLDLLARSPAEPSYAVAVATVCAASGLDLKPALAAFLHAQAANLVSAGVRLIPLGQTHGQRALATLESEVLRAVDACLARPDEDIGSATPIIELCSMLHETQYTRLFRS